MPTFDKKTPIPVSADALYRWHTRPGAFDLLVPPFQKVRVVERPERLEEGCRLVMKIYQGPFGLTWVAEHRDFVEGRQFVDVQTRGPFAKWVHTHRFVPDRHSAGDSASILHDHVEYTLPMGKLGEWVGGGMTRRMLERMFAFRHSRTRGDLMRHKAFEDEPRKRVAITGASGFIGSRLTNFLTTGGHTVVPLVRDREEAGDDAIYWNVKDREIDAERLEGIDVMIHLAGENIFGRWTEAKKRRIMESRKEGTELVARTLAELADPPEVFLCSSGADYYGAQGADPVDESDGPGEGFLAEVCQAWEAATEPAARAGIRTVNMRTGMVLSAEGGALSTMLTPFKMGLGGRFGSGDQYMSWIHLDDMLGAIQFCMFRDDLEGPVNFVSPGPVTNREFTAALGEALHRPTFLPVPKFGAKLLFGQMAEEMLLTGQRVQPTKLQEAGFEWEYPELQQALAAELD